MRDGTRAFFQIQGNFHYFRAFKTEILHIYNTKTIISLSVCDQRRIFTSPLRGSVSIHRIYPTSE